MGHYTSFTGIDTSKRWIDIAVISSDAKPIDTARIANESTAIYEFVTTMAPDLTTMLFCMEDNGRYTDPFLAVALPLGLHAWLDNPLRIKRSLGLLRGKSDTLDARRIAEYALRFHDKAILWKEEHPVIVKLRDILSKRDLLIKIQTQLKLSDGQGTDTYLATPLKAMKDTINAMEKSMKNLVRSDPSFLRQYELLSSIPGVGPIVSTTMIVITKGFTRLTDPRKLSCYAGIAPFPRSSGTTLSSTPRVSKIGNPKLKSLLHTTSLQAIRFIPEVTEYYHRKVDQGKNKMSAINAVRNKMVAIMLSVIRRDTLFDPEYRASIKEKRGSSSPH